MYQAQEVAAVLATEPLHRGRRRRRGRGRLRAAAGGGRSVQGARAGRAGAAHRQEGQEGQPHLALGGGRPGRHRAGLRRAPRSSVKQDIYIPRIHVASIETCGCVADFDKSQRQAHGLDDHAGAARDPHRVRAGRGHVGLSEEKIRIISPDIGGGFGGKVPVYPGYVIAVAASVVTGKPVKWIEDRMENLQADSFARDYHITAELAAKQGRHDHRRCASRRWPTTATPTPRPTRRSSRPGCSRICTGSYDLKQRIRRGRRRLHQQAAGRHRLPLLVPRHRGGARDRAHGRRAGARAEDGPGRAAHEELHPARAVPVQVGARLGVRQRQLRRRRCELAMEMIGYADAAQGAGREARARRADGHRHLAASPRSSAPARRSTSTSSASRCSTRAEIRVHPTGKAIARFGTKSQGQGHETTYAQIVAEELGIPAAHIAGRGRRHRHRAVRPRHLRQPLDADRRRGRARWPRARSATRRRKIAAHLLEVQRGRPGVGARQVLGQGLARASRRRSRRSRSPPTPTTRRAWRPGSRRSTTTIRRT